MHNNLERPASSRTISAIAREAAQRFLPPGTGFSQLDAYLYGWKRHHEYVIAGRESAAVADMTMSFVRHFASTNGQVIWIGNMIDLKDACDRMILSEAGMTASPKSAAGFDASQQAIVIDTFNRCCSWPIDLLNIADCGDPKFETEFCVNVSSDLPTLIVVEPGAFDDGAQDASTTASRRAHLARMIAELKKSNPDWRILWNLPLRHRLSTDWESVPKLSEILEDQIASRAKTVLFTHMQEGDGELPLAQLIVAKNGRGSTGTIDRQYVPGRYLWAEN